jgi:anaerobic magnesium-protoporphyrin IX monomethyl ester cyclase
VTQGTIFRTLAAERIVEEMRLLNSCYRVHRFQFLDPLWTADHEHAEALCNALIQSGLSRRVQWSCETRADLLDLFLLDRMAKAGCRELHLGLESVSPEALVALGRLASPQDAPEYLRRFQQVVRACRTLNVACHVHLIDGVPGDEGGTEAARAFLRSCPPDTIHVTPLTLYPGTSLLPLPSVTIEPPEPEAPDALTDDLTTKPRGWLRAVSRLRSLPSA